jgi:outer membrane immunogenic protein
MVASGLFAARLSHMPRQKGVGRMKKLLLSALTFTALAVAPALAADLPRKAPPRAIPPAPPPPLTWTGCYIGANVGAVRRWFDVDFNFAGFSEDSWGFTGGGQIGCDYQFADRWVIGVRNMFNGTTGNKDITINRFGDPIFDGATVNLKNQWFDALTGRVGYVWSPAWLLYAQGGAVWSCKGRDRQWSPWFL